MKKIRRLGQVFLNSQVYINRVLERVEPCDVMVEVGPGLGGMTQTLAQKAGKLYCVELDSRFCAALSEKFKNFPNVKIINKSILDFALSGIGGRAVIFGSIPYQISKPIVHYLTGNRQYIRQAYLVCQKEFALKLTALPSAPGYGLLTCLTQYYARVTKLLDIPAQAFSPRPKVDSSFISVEFYNELPVKVTNEEKFFDILRTAFSRRRKKITNALAGKVSADAFTCCGVNPWSRPEDISIAQYIAFADGVDAGKDI